ncbi:MAG TPA: FAD-binding oxidoreductase [Patescibacteria group bacterium]|nr:FAD-binding oxidoreductase [Patescibacteria group bacterium]
MNDLQNKLKAIIKGDVLEDEETLKTYSHDASIFEVKPQVVVFPKDTEDLKALVKFVNENKGSDTSLSLTARSGGTDMGGGSINDSIIVGFEKYFNHIISVDKTKATAQPGVFYRDFEKETLKHDSIFPSYPASREICAIGGIVNNNSGGEKSLAYGKTENYVKKLKVVLSDGNEYTLEPLNKQQLDEKIKQNNFEGQIYRKIFDLITNNLSLIADAKPRVSKNSAGYYLWNVYDKENETFDLTKLFVGAQGTLGFVTEAEIGLVPVKKHAEMMILFVHDLTHLGEIINTVLPLKPDTFEAYDDNTLKLALKFFPEFAKLLGTKGTIRTALAFLPEFLMTITGGLPKLILQVDFQSDSKEELNLKIGKLKEALKPLRLKTRIADNETKELKYWLIRRESFNLLRQKIHDKHTAPFIDDFVVLPQYLPEFLPRLNKILKKYPSLISTIAGHVGDGNFHIIPLMNIEDPKQREIIPILEKEVYDLVLEYKGSITGEHNDGLIRTPYLKQMYGEKVYKLFEETKKIFDPQNIFNPRKKVGGSLEYSTNHIRTNFT